MMSHSHLIARLQLLGFIALFALTSAFSTHATSGELLPGDTAPNWVLSDTEGNTQLFYDELEQNAAVLLVFSASWCERCKTLLPKLETLSQQLNDKKVKTYLLSIWEDSQGARHLKEQAKYLTVLTQAEAVAKKYQIKGTPTLILVGANRKILHINHPNVPLNQIPFEQTLKELSRHISTPSQTPIKNEGDQR